MIVSHKHKCIFLKAEKTAGTSMEVALSRICDSDDIITPITREDEIIRTSLGYRGPQNYLVPWKEHSLQEWKLFCKRRKRRKKYFNHMPALRAKMTLGEEVWGEYFTFCFERNPWDRVVSLFFWIKKNTSHTNYTFDQFLEEQEGKIRRYSTFYRDAQRKVMVDKIYRFEDIPFALEDISKKLSLSTPLDLPKEKCKGNTERNGTHYSEILTPKQADTISGWCKESIDLFGYSYENISQRKEMSRKNSKAYSRQIPRAELC